MEELYHYGVPGMKWGIRRSRGEIRAERTKRQVKNLNAGSSIGKNSSNAFKEASNAARTIGSMSRPSKKVRRDLSTMSDQELRSRINRMQMEQTYASLNPSRVSRGSNHAANILSVAGSIAAIGASAAGIAVAIKQLKS